MANQQQPNNRSAQAPSAQPQDQEELRRRQAAGQTNERDEQFNGKQAGKRPTER